MKKILFGLIFCISMIFCSCTTLGQSYTKVYYDYVIEGVVDDVGYLNDGNYSYHIISEIPVDGYWELYPYEDRISIYNRYMVFQRWFYPDMNWVLYHNGRHHMYVPRYKTPPIKPKPKSSYRPPQQNNKRPVTSPRRNGGGNHRR